MPSWQEHVKFVKSKPYQAWYIIEDDNEEVGAVYLTKKGEIGIGILPAFQRMGIAKKAIESIMMLHRRDKYFANIAPYNERSENLFIGLGFRHIQNTFVLE